MTNTRIEERVGDCNLKNSIKKDNTKTDFSSKAKDISTHSGNRKV